MTKVNVGQVIKHTRCYKSPVTTLTKIQILNTVKLMILISFFNDFFVKNPVFSINFQEINTAFKSLYINLFHIFCAQ